MEQGIWKIDSAHSGIHFSVRHMVFAKVRGRFGRFEGTIHGNDTDLTQASVEVEIDAASIDTGVADRDTHLRSPDFFDTERFPKLTFKSARVEKVTDDRYRVHGELTIHGVTRESVLDVEYGGRGKDPWGNERTAFTATASLDRTDFGLKWNQALETGGLVVGERVDIELEIEAVKAAASRAA